MFSKMIDWWNDDEQTLLRHETARARRFFCSKFGILLIVIQFLLSFRRFQQSDIYGFFTLLGFGAMSGVALSVYTVLIAPLVDNIIWFGLFYEYVVKRFRRPACEDMLVVPLTPRMMWPALIAIPLIWCGISAATTLSNLLIKLPFLAIEESWSSVIFRLAMSLQHIFLLCLFTFVSALYLNSKTSLAWLFRIILTTNFLVILIQTFFQITTWSLMGFFVDPEIARFLDTMFFSPFVEFLTVLLLLVANVYLLKRLRRKKGLDAFVEEEVTHRPPSVVSSSGGS